MRKLIVRNTHISIYIKLFLTHTYTNVHLWKSLLYFSFLFSSPISAYEEIYSNISLIPYVLKRKTSVANIKEIFIKLK